jgi:uncharacterized membrane protein YhaH (DUF805 family)
MNFFEAIVSCLKKYATFSGRASRSEFWFFFLFRLLVGMIGGILDKTVLQDYQYPVHVGAAVQSVGLLAMILPVIFFLPGLAVTIRRLHDVNRSGWWIFISVTIIGIFFPMLYWYCKKGTEGDNRFGSDPLGVNA